jgi:hypothetical protein
VAKQTKGKIASSLANPLDVPVIRRFVLSRKEDISGTSGTGVVASGVIFSSGTCVICWNSIVSSVSVFHSIADLEKIHGHEGATEVRFIDV